jgi:hypothetical protein
VLFSSEPGEFIEIDAHVAEDLTQKASSDVLTLMDGDDRCPTVFVLPERMAPLLSVQPKSYQATEKGPFTALASSRGAATYELSTPRTAHRVPPCTWIFLSSLGEKSSSATC